MWMSLFFPFSFVYLQLLFSIDLTDRPLSTFFVNSARRSTQQQQKRKLEDANHLLFALLSILSFLRMSGGEDGTAKIKQLDEGRRTSQTCCTLHVRAAGIGSQLRRRPGSAVLSVFFFFSLPRNDTSTLTLGRFILPRKVESSIERQRSVSTGVINENASTFVHTHSLSDPSTELNTRVAALALLSRKKKKNSRKEKNICGIFLRLPTQLSLSLLPPASALQLFYIPICFSFLHVGKQT
jgi:hypothetical protein